MYADAKRRDVQPLLFTGVPQERIQELTGVSAPTIRRTGREAAKIGSARMPNLSPSAFRTAPAGTKDQIGAIERCRIPESPSGAA